MSVDIDAVRVGLTGAFSKGPVGTAAPTDATTAINVAFVDSGAISEDGVTLTLPGAGDKTVLKMWQNGAQVRTLRQTSDDVPQLQFTFLETNKTSVETYFGVDVTQTADHGTFDYDGTVPDAFAGVLDVIDGANIHRFHLPEVVRAEVGDLVYKNDEAIGYNVTLDLEKNATAGYYLRGWMTDLATP
jgi:hypothetical protein